MNALREGAKRVGIMKKNVAKVTPPNTQGNGSCLKDHSKNSPSSISDVIPSLWPWQDSVSHHFNLNDLGLPVTDLNTPSMVVLTCFKSMTWIISNKNSSSSSKIAVINMKLQDYGKGPLGETEVQFRVTRVTLEPMLRSMTYISQQLNAPVNRVAIINLRLQDTKTTTGQTELKFQVSRDTLGSMLRSVTYIQEQL
ncbi:hypothetical protein AAZX31_15G209200 [Glycine max]